MFTFLLIYLTIVLVLTSLGMFTDTFESSIPCSIGFAVSLAGLLIILFFNYWYM